MKKLQSLLLICAGMITAQRAKPVIDPETKDGLLIQHIQQESDPVEKLHYMEQFAVQYPSHSAAAWVYDQLQMVYLNLKDWDQAIRIGERRLTLEPENLEAAKIALRAAEAKQNVEDFARWADRTWQIAAKLVAKYDVATSDKRSRAAAADARETQLYSEYCIYTAAMRTPDLKARLAMLESLGERNPKSQYVKNLAADSFSIYRQLGDMAKAILVAERTLDTDPENLDMLMAIADYHFRKGDAREKVVIYAARAVEAMGKASRPEVLDEEAWGKRKAQMRGSAYYMGGVSSYELGQYGRSDQMLRSALPFLSADAAMEATALYYLGISNYRLATAGDQRRAVDALKFTRLCAGIKSGFQPQALKNIDSIKSEYNLP